MTAARSTVPVASRRHRLTRPRRRQTFGVTEPGTYSRIPAWLSREHYRSELYADLHSDDVRRMRAQVGTRGPVSISVCYALGYALSGCADSATGRNALPGTAALTTKPDDLDLDDPAYWAKLTAATGYGKTSLQKAAQVLEARGWLSRVRTGKNWLTRAERQELWRAGSAARQRRNVWACTMPAHLRNQPPTNPTGDRPQPVPDAGNEPTPDQPTPDQPTPDQPVPAVPVDNFTDRCPQPESGCALPTTRRVSGLSPVSENKIFKPEQASTNAPSGRPTTNQAPRKRAYRADWRTVRLAKDLRARLYWLHDTPHQRIMPALDRFARAGWTAADVQRELDAMLATRNWQVPDARITLTRAGKEYRNPLRCPWGYLAMLLRTLEPTDLEAQREYDRAMRAAQLDYQRLRHTGPECAHGEPAGDVPSPIKGIRACPLCRRSSGNQPRADDGLPTGGGAGGAG